MNVVSCQADLMEDVPSCGGNINFKGHPIELDSDRLCGVNIEINDYVLILLLNVCKTCPVMKEGMGIIWMFILIFWTRFHVVYKSITLLFCWW